MPATVPRVQTVCATPALFDVDVAGVTVPAPTPTSHPTVAPEMVFPEASVTTTASGTASAVPTTPVCPEPPESRIAAGVALGPVVASRRQAAKSIAPTSHSGNSTRNDRAPEPIRFALHTRAMRIHRRTI